MFVALCVFVFVRFLKTMSSTRRMSREAHAGICTLLICLGLCSLVVACFAGVNIWPKPKMTGDFMNRASPQENKEEEAPQPFYVAVMGGCIALACATLVSL